MAEQQGVERQGSAGTPDVAYTVDAERRLPLPDAASADMVWECAGEHIDYTATAGYIDVRTDAGALMGKMFSLAYVANRPQDAAVRPVTFCYNGGPGSASVPINVGGIGPRRVVTDGLDHLPATPRVEDNPATLLSQSDLVFLDALGTGYSVVAEDTHAQDMWSVDGDADTFARAIAAWLTDNGRWGDPVYLFGESYGTVRNAVLMRVLAERFIPVTGVIMLSSVFDWVQKMPGSDLGFMGLFPTYAATARHFGKAGEGTDEASWFDEAMDFSERVYGPALLRGDRLTPEEKTSLAAEMSQRIGLSAEIIERNNLRIDLDTFRRTLLADEGLVTGRFDTRFTTHAPCTSLGGTTPIMSDASSDAVEPAWNAAFRRHLQEIGFAGAPIYPLSNFPKIGITWDRSHAAPDSGMRAAAPNVAYDIAAALKHNPTMRMLVIGGRYDAATPYWNVVRDLSCLFLPEELKRRVELKLYSCGHMAYVDEPTLEVLGRDLAAFVR